MRITFENIGQFQETKEKEALHVKESRNSTAASFASYRADLSDYRQKPEMIKNAYKEEKGTSDFSKMAEMSDATQAVDYLTVMSHTMSGEDFGKMLEEGVDPGETDPATSVTILDRIKVEVAKSGKRIEGFTDEIDEEVLQEIAGSEVIASALVNAFAQSDIPFTKENIKEASDAIEKIADITPLSEGELKYAIENLVTSTVQDLYLVKHSGAKDANRQGSGFFEERVGYLSRKADTFDESEILPQIEKKLEEIGKVVSEETVRDAEWMIEKGIPLTKEGFETMEAMKELSLPVPIEEAAKRVAETISEGKSATQTDLSFKKEGMTALLLHNRRVLEEARIRLTSEVNRKLVQSGFAIDTTDMESLIEAIKTAEKELAKEYFPSEESEEKALASYDIWERTNEVRKDLYSVPVSALSSVWIRKAKFTPEELHTEGQRQQAAFEKIQTEYESLMTSPRRDLGDSIQKAFRNVDDILKDLNLETDEQNRRSVRILGYNRIPITKENLEAITKADIRVRRVIEAMTPHATLKMVRSGVNPLTTSFEELEEFLKKESEAPEKQMLTYSRFLANMEREGEVSASEREAYIGIYRMLHQIEKNDGAVIGSIVNAGKELNFASLLSAARSAKKSGMNLVIDESFGGLSKVQYEDIPIDVQILSAEADILNNSSETVDRFLKWQEEVKQLRARGNETKDGEKLLDSLQLEKTIPYLSEASDIRKKSSKQWERLSRQIGKEKVISLGKDILDAFDKEEEAETIQGEIKKVQEELFEESFRPELSAEDIQGRRASHIFLSVAAGMAKEETYEIPIETKKGISSIRVTIKHEKDAQGSATITVPTENDTDVTADITITSAGVTGTVNMPHLNREEKEAFTARWNQMLDKEGKEDAPSKTAQIYRVSKAAVILIRETL